MASFPSNPSNLKMNFIVFFLVAVSFATYCQARAVGVRLGNMNNVTSSNCGGNCPGGCSSCPCGTTTNYQDIASWCSKHSWNQANCQCIMSHESSGNGNAANQNGDGSFDVGLWQINDYNWNACSGGAAPCDGNTNLNCAIDVYNWGGKTWQFWSTCGACGACNSA